MPVPSSAAVSHDGETPATSSSAIQQGRRAAVLALFFVMGAELFLVPPMLGEIDAGFDVGPSAGAWVVSGYVIAYAVCTPFFGAIGDRFARRNVIGLGASVYALGALGCAMAPVFPALLLAHALTGLGGALLAPAVWAYLAEEASAESRGRAVAAGAAAYNGGQIVGVPLGAVTASAVGWRWAFSLVAVASIGCAVWARATVRSSAAAETFVVADRLRESFRLWGRATFRLTVAATTLSQAARLGAYTYVTVVFGPRFGLSLIALGVVGGIAGLGSLLGAFAAGPAVDRWRRRGGAPATLCTGWGIVLAAALVVSLTAHSVVVAVIALMVWFAAGGAFYSTGQAMLAVAVPDRRAAAVSWNNAAMNAGVAIGAAALGLLAADAWSFGVVAAALAIAASAISELNRRAA